MDWTRFTQWLETLEVDEVAVRPLLDDFPGFPCHRLGGYVNPSGESTVAVSHLEAVADRYGDEGGDGHGGSSEASDDSVGVAHNTAVPDDHEKTTKTGGDEYQFLKDKIKEIDAIHGRDTAE